MTTSEVLILLLALGFLGGGLGVLFWMRDKPEPAQAPGPDTSTLGTHPVGDK
jgi:hypothetical protein